MSDMFMERRSSDILFQQSVSSMSVETVRRVDNILVLIEVCCIYQALL